MNTPLPISASPCLRVFILTLAGLIGTLCIPRHAVAQGGSLSPTGAPAPTMKTLDQIEPRTIVSDANTPGDATNSFIISTPGSYYLTGEITGEADKHGISIQADHVTLDLSGFSLVGGGGTTRGVDVPAAQTNLRIRNGIVRGWTDGGVRADAVRNVHAEKLTLSGNTGAVGLYVGLGSLIKDCIANANDVGIRTPDRCQVISCISTENASQGFLSGGFVMFADCTSSRNGLSGGIFSRDGFATAGSCGFVRCSATRNAGWGITAGTGSTISDCNAGSNVYGGISAGHSSIVNCVANNNTSYGIAADFGTVKGSTASSNGGGGITAFSGTVSDSSANSNLSWGILAGTGSVANCRAGNNSTTGIDVTFGAVTHSVAISNGASGIRAGSGSITNCVATSNAHHGIDGDNCVIAFCRASANNTASNGSLDISGAAASRSTNLPAP